MAESDIEDASSVLGEFLATDQHYRDSSPAYGDGGVAALGAALRLFLERPEIGFVWLAYEQGTPVAACVVCFAISTSAGAVVAKLDDVCVVSGREGRGVGSALLDSLKGELRRLQVRRIDTSCHLDNRGAKRFYEKHGFHSLNEERLALLL